MSKLLRLLPLLLMMGIAFGGGMVENTNQSADFHRMLARNASTDLDAVFFNPAGLTKLSDGMHIYLSNQTITQGREITSDFAYLHEEKFVGETFAPVFPNFYFAYKMDKLVFSGGFVPVGGGGSATFDDGLPSFEAPIASLVPLLSPTGVTDYAVDVEFEGSSVYLGGQFMASYAINDMLSVSAGVRYFSATNTYEGHLKDIKVSTAAGDVIPGDVMRGVAAQYAAGAASATAGAASLQPLIDGGAGDDVFDALTGGWGGNGRADLGSGNDTVRGFGSGTFDGGFGFDTLVFNAGTYNIARVGSQLDRFEITLSSLQNSPVMTVTEFEFFGEGDQQTSFASAVAAGQITFI